MARFQLICPTTGSDGVTSDGENGVNTFPGLNGFGDTTFDQPTPPSLIGKERIVYDSELWRVVTEGEMNVSQTPFRHYSEDRPREWSQNAGSLDLDHFRFVVGSQYAAAEVRPDDIAWGNPYGLNLISIAPGYLPFRAFKGEFLSAPEPIPGNPLFPGTSFKQRLKLEADNDFFYIRNQILDENFVMLKSNWEKYVNGGPIANLNRNGDIIDLRPLIERGKDFFDHHTSLEVPLLPPDFKRGDEEPNIRNPLKADVKSDYNFFIEKYEEKLSELISTGGVRTKELPDLYVFEYEKRTQNRDDANTVLNKMITLDGNLNNENSSYFRDIIIQGPGNIDLKIGETDRGDYFLDWSEVYQREILRSSGISPRFDRIVIDTDDMRFLSSVNQKKHLFPMYNEIMFGTDRNTQISDLIKQTNMNHPVILATTLRSWLEPIAAEKNFNFLTKKFTSAEEFSYDHTLNKRIRVFDLLEFISQFKETGGEELRNLQPVVMTNDPAYEALVNEGNSLAKIIAVMIVTGRMTDIIKNNSRTFNQILAGQKAYSETIAYKIKKYRGQTRSEGSLEQTIYIPNNSDIDIFEHIDTKVAYEQEYTYEVEAVQVVIGARYDYLAELRLDDQARQIQNPVRVIDRPRSEPQMFLEVDVRIHPSVKIVEVPYFVAKAKVLDSAPLPPDVNIVPYRGINNKMLLLFNAQVGRIEEAPVSIQPEDDQLFEDYKQSRSITGENIIFEGDDEVESFEVFRTTRPPESYTDFRGLLHEVVATEPMGANFDASSAAFRDTIQPNTKYYYTFRARDVHGNVSNPTDVFQVEMVEEDGAVYPLIEVYNMVPEDPTEPTRKFKRFLYIKANPVHSTVTERRQVIENNTPMGEEEHTIFNPDTGTEPPFLYEAAKDTSIGVGRGIAPALYGDSTRPGKFKFRIKSKKTGRKIDINLNFIHEIIDKL